MNNDKLITVERLCVDYRQPGHRVLHALTDVSLDIAAGETLGIVGESGCGKSTLGRAITRLLRPTAGSVYYRGQRIDNLKERDFAPYRRKVQMVFQDPYASLDPRMNVRDLVAEPLETYRVCASREETTERVKDLLESVGMSADTLGRYAHQFSGGQRQRIGIARALALSPELIVCDEPVSALDVSIQNQILNLLRELREKHGMAYLFISHDLSVVRFISDRVCVMYMGHICEIGSTEALYAHPLHPYTRFLIDARPVIGRQRTKRQLITGELPDATSRMEGCCFCTRCPYATQRCAREIPSLTQRGGRLVACHRDDIFTLQ